MAITIKHREKDEPKGDKKTGIKAAKTSKSLPPEGTQGHPLDELISKPKRVIVNTQPMGPGQKRKRSERKAAMQPEDLDALLEDTGAPMTDELRKERSETQKAKMGGGRIRATKEAVEYRRKQVLRLMLRGVPKQTIAEHLGLTVRQVYEDATEINRDLRSELQNFDYPLYIGMSVSFYDEARNIALRLATDNKEKSNTTKMTALRVALQAEDSKHDFLAKVGLFRVAAPTDPFNSIQTGRQGSYSDENDIQNFLDALSGVRDIEGEVVDDTEGLEPEQPEQPVEGSEDA